MLDTIKDCIAMEEESSEDFYTFYNNYVKQIQDMDIDNEILSFVRDKTTNYIKRVKKLERERNKRMKNLYVMQ